MELPSPNANNYLHIEPRYLNAFLTPSPSDVTMGSPSPIEIMSAASIDVPDAVLCKNLQNVVGAAEVREQFISALTADNGNVKHVASRAPAYPGQAKQIVVASENGVVRIVDEVGGSLDESTAKRRQPGPSTSGECALEKDRGSSTVEGVTKGKIHVGQRETSDFRSNGEISGVKLDRANDDRKIVVKSQPGSSNFSELALEEGSNRSTVGAKNTEVLDLGPKTELVGSTDDCGVIVNIQPGASSSTEVAPIQGGILITENVARGRIMVGQIEDLKFKTKIVDVSLGSSDDHEVIIQIQSDQPSSSEVRLRECCWPTRGNPANDRVEIAEVREIIEIGSISGVSESRRIVDKVEQGSALFLESNSEEVSPRKELVDIEPYLDYVDDVVNVQPGHFNHSTVTEKEDHNLETGRIKLDEIDSEHLDQDDKSLDNPGGTANNDVFDDKGIDSRRQIAELKEAKQIRTTTSPLNVSMTSLDGRHECALSDFSVDKEDYRLSQYGSEEEDEDKLPCSAKLSVTDVQSEDTLDSINDCKSGANIQAVGTMAREDASKGLMTKATDEEFVKDRSPLRDDENSVINVGKSEKTEEVSTIVAEAEKKIEKGSEWDAQSLEKRAISCDPSSEIDGKYLKSIVNSRKSPRKVKEGQIRDTELKKPKNRQALRSEVLQNPPAETKRIKQGQTTEAGIANKDEIIDDRKVEASQNPLRTGSVKTKSSTKVGGHQIGENNREFKDQSKFISDRETGKVCQMFSTATSTKSPKRLRDKQIYHKSGEMKDYDRSINDRVISQLEQVFQSSAKKSSTKTTESPKKNPVEQQSLPTNRPVDDRQADGEKIAQHSSKISFTESPRRTQSHKANEQKATDDKTKRDINEIKDVYTRKVRRYNMPLQGSLDSMIVSDEPFAPKPKKDDTFSKKSKSYESIKRIQEVFLGAPGKMSSSGSQLDIPDEFCSICCYMNEVTLRTEEEMSSPNQETFYTLRSTCSSLADDDDSTECDICGSLNQQEAADALEGKILMDSAHGEIPCELCRICGEVDGSYDQNTMIPADRYAFRLVEPSQDDDDSFEIENCGFQSGTESTDDRSRVSESIQESDRSKSRSLFIHGSSMMRDQPRELYFIPKDEIAILTSGTRKVGRKGSLFRKKEEPRDNRRYSSVDSLQLAKMAAKTADKAFKVAKNPTLVASADNLRISRRGSRRSKSLQRTADDAGRRDSLTDNLDGPIGKEEDATSADSAQKPNIRDKEAVKMILTQHGIKIISEKETAL